MNNVQQLIKKSVQEGRFKDIFPKTYTEAIIDRETGEFLNVTLEKVNFLFLPFVNSDAATRLLVPDKMRRRGLWISYIEYNGTLKSEYYNSDSLVDVDWQDSSNWLGGGFGDLQGVVDTIRDWVNSFIQDLITEATKLNPEDLNKNNSNQIQLADRDSTNGMGYVILRKNKTFAEQVTKENTIYEIRYDFDLEGGTLNIPSNCTLKFEGGSISNGIIVGDDTSIISSICIIFKDNINLRGTFDVEQGYIEWFVNPNGGNDCSHAFEQFDAVGIPIRLLKNTYCTSKTLRLTNNPIIEGEKLWQSTIRPTSGAIMDILLYISKEDGSAINSGYIKNINIEGYQYGTSTQGSKVGLLVSNATEMFTISHIRLLHHQVGLYVTKTWFCLFEAITCVSNTQYNYYINSADDLDLGINVGAINNVIFRNCASKGANIGTYIKGWNMAIAFDTCDWEYDTGEAEVLMQENHASVTFLNCYWETDITLIKNVNTYRNGKTIIIGGVFDDRGVDVIPLIIGKQSSFSLIGTYNEANNSNKAYEYYITTEALYNSLIGAVLSGTKGCINPLADDSYIYADGGFNNYQQYFSNCTANKVYAAPSINAISKVVNDKCPAQLRVGKTEVSQSSDGQTYQLRIAHRHPNDGITVQACVNSGGNETLIDLFSILNKQIRCVAPNGYTVQNFSTLPSSYLQHGRIGMYGDAVAEKNRYRPVILGDTKWRDSNGQPANLQPYGASLPDSTDLLPGFIFEDTVNNRILYFNHDSSWIDLSTGTISKNTSGTTEERPSSGGKIGFMYFDTTLNKPIYWTGSKWVDATGADVSIASVSVEEVPASQDITY